MSEPSARILRPSDLPVADRGGGASTVRMVSSAAGAKNLLNGVTTIPPSGGIPRHFHNVEESVLVLSGAAIVELDGVESAAAAGDVVFAPAGLPHRFRNPSETEPLRIFWTYASASATRTLCETGETRPIDAEHAEAATGDGAAGP